MVSDMKKVGVIVKKMREIEFSGSVGPVWPIPNS